MARIFVEQRRNQSNVSRDGWYTPIVHGQQPREWGGAGVERLVSASEQAEDGVEEATANERYNG